MKRIVLYILVLAAIAYGASVLIESTAQTMRAHSTATLAATGEA